MKHTNDYSGHLAANMKVAARALKRSGFFFIMALFHAVHAIIPAEITKHDYWGLKGKPD